MMHACWYGCCAAGTEAVVAAAHSVGCCSTACLHVAQRLAALYRLALCCSLAVVAGLLVAKLLQQLCYPLGVTAGCWGRVPPGPIGWETQSLTKPTRIVLKLLGGT
jgi:hypothetical protein